MQRHRTGASGHNFPYGTFPWQLSKPQVWQDLGNRPSAADALCVAHPTSSLLCHNLHTGTDTSDHPTGIWRSAKAILFVLCNISVNKGEPEHLYFQLLILQLSYLSYWSTKRTRWNSREDTGSDSIGDIFPETRHGSLTLNLLVWLENRNSITWL